MTPLKVVHLFFHMLENRWLDANRGLALGDANPVLPQVKYTVVLFDEHISKDPDGLSTLLNQKRTTKGVMRL